MADQEMIKHTKAAYKALNNPLTSWKHKLKEILIEILIIVFAISLSIWLHDWSEKRHERHEAKIFLEGLRTDLTNDIAQLEGDKKTYLKVNNGINYFLKVSGGEAINKDSLDAYSFTLFNTTIFNVNGSRYQALKGSGKLNIIEDQELLNTIINFYEQIIPFINILNGNFNEYKRERIGNFLDDNLDGSSIVNWEIALRKINISNALRREQHVDDIISQYEDAKKSAAELIKLIDKALGK